MHQALYRIYAFRETKGVSMGRFVRELLRSQAGQGLSEYLIIVALASLSISLFASSLARTQVVAVLVAGVLLAMLFLVFFLASMTDPPINSFILALSIFHVRQRSFMNGVLKLENVLFNLAIAYVFLLATTKTLEARRWR